MMPMLDQATDPTHPPGGAPPASVDPVAAYLQTYGKGGGQSASPTASTGADPVASYLQKYGKGSTGNIDLRQASDDTRVAPGAGKAPSLAPPFSPAPWYQKIPEAVASGLPGGRGAVALGTGIADLLLPKALGGTGFDAAIQDAAQSLKTQKKDVASLPFLARAPLQMLGGAPLAMAAAPLGMVGGGAAFGAAQGADADAKTLGGVAGHTILGAGLGAAGGLLVKGIGNLADRSGLTDAAGKGLQKLGMSPDVTSGIGTAGQVNTAMQTRQGLLGDVGDVGETAAKQQLDQQAAFKAQTDANYNLARQDAAVLRDPELNALLQDKDVAPILQKVSAIRGSGTNPMPTPTTNTILSPRDNGLLAKDDIDAAAAAFDQQYGRPGGTGTVLPDPEAIHSLKRYLNDSVNRGMDSQLEITRDQARALLPKAQAITERLHALSPDYAAADAFHAQGMGNQEAYNLGVDAARNSANPTADNLATNSAEGLEKSITTPRYPGEPPEAIASRYEAFQRGMRANAGDIIRGAPVDKRMAGVVSDPFFANTTQAQSLRKLMFDNPEQQQTLEQTIGNLTGRSQQAGGSGGNTNQPVINMYSALRKLVRSGATPDLLRTPQGATMINQLSGNPELLQQSLTAASGPGASLKMLLRSLGVDVAGQATGGIFGPSAENSQ